MRELKIMSVLRVICLIPLFMVYGAWMLLKFTLGLIVLALTAWLMHTLFGKVGDGLLALPVIYFLSLLLPNPRIGDIANTLSFKNKSLMRQRNNVAKARVLDFKTYRRGEKP
jgi:hypothetical protein